MRAVGVGHLLFSLGFAMVGAIGLGAHDFVLWQQPVPEKMPWRETLACISGALLLLTAVGSLVSASGKPSMLVLTAYLLLWVLALHLPRAVAQPGVESNWLGVGEVSSLTAGGWLIFCAIAGRNDGSIQAARILFGLALVPIGLSHFVYLQGAAGLIPSWFPFRVPLTAFTGAAHIAAGIAIVSGIVPRLAATLEAVMESLLTLIVWGSDVVATPTNRQDWVSIFISTALTGAAWALAESYRQAPWSFARRTWYTDLLRPGTS